MGRQWKSWKIEQKVRYKGNLLKNIDVEISVIYLARGVDYGIDDVKRFLDSYKNNPAGIEHEFVIAAKGWEKKPEEYKDLLELADEYNAKVINLADDGFDLWAYFRVSQILNLKYVFFINTSSVILKKDWLVKFYDAFKSNPNLKLAGATGSSEVTSNPVAAIRHEYWKTRKKTLKNKLFVALKVLIYKFFVDFKLVLARKYRPIKFPNYHIRTNGFFMEREMFLDFMGQKKLPKNKNHAYELESGHNGLTKFIMQRGNNAVVIGADGIAYKPEDWKISKTSVNPDSSNLILSDNHTRLYDFWNIEERKSYEKKVWGEVLTKD